MAGFVTPYYAGRLATLDPGGVTVSLMTSDFIPAIANGHLVDVEEYEVSTSDAPGYTRSTSNPTTWVSATGELRIGYSVVPTFNVAGATDIRHVVVTHDNNNDRIVAVLSWPEPRTGFNGFKPFGDDPANQIVAAVVQTSGVEQIRAGTNITVDASLPSAPEISAHPERPGPWEPLATTGDLQVTVGQGVRRVGTEIEVSATMLFSPTGPLAYGQVLVELPPWAWPLDEQSRQFAGVLAELSSGGVSALRGGVIELGEAPTGWVLRVLATGAGDNIAGWLGPLTWGATT